MGPHGLHTGIYAQDSSALGRLNAWWMAFNLAKANFFGGGFAIYNAQTFALYAPDPTDIHAAHSIYFMVLGEHGFVGLALFLLLWILVCVPPDVCAPRRGSCRKPCGCHIWGPYAR